MSKQSGGTTLSLDSCCGDCRSVTFAQSLQLLRPLCSSQVSRPLPPRIDGGQVGEERALFWKVLLGLVLGRL